MKLAVFDVSNGSCSLVLDKNGNSLMIDCGGHGEKDCPVDLINQWRSDTNGWMSPMNTHSHNGVSYPLTRLQVTHPDLDHIKNVGKVHTHLQPLILHRTNLSHYDIEEIDNDSDALSHYRRIDTIYNLDITTEPSFPDIKWSFEFHKSYSIHPNFIKQNYELSAGGATKNNSSIVTLIIEDNIGILFGGDMERAGWKYLIDNNINGFADDIQSYQIDIFVAPHHGHNSGYSPELFEKITPSLIIISKGIEEGADSDVSPNYYQKPLGDIIVHTLQGVPIGARKSVTTRYDGHIFVETLSNDLRIHTSKGYPTDLTSGT